MLLVSVLHFTTGFITLSSGGCGSMTTFLAISARLPAKQISDLPLRIKIGARCFTLYLIILYLEPAAQLGVSLWNFSQTGTSDWIMGIRAGIVTGLQFIMIGYIPYLLGQLHEANYNKRHPPSSEPLLSQTTQSNDASNDVRLPENMFEEIV